MVRFMLAVCVLIVAVVLAPLATADPALNSADLIVGAAPVVFLFLLWPRHRPRRRRAPWIAEIPETHPDALGSLDQRERLGAPDPTTHRRLTSPTKGTL